MVLPRDKIGSVQIYGIARIERHEEVFFVLLSRCGLQSCLQNNGAVPYFFAKLETDSVESIRGRCMNAPITKSNSDSPTSIRSRGIENTKLSEPEYE